MYVIVRVGKCMVAAVQWELLMLIGTNRVSRRKISEVGA
jgi:hypothetical protein